MATLMERLSFLQKVPTLMKATADDETPCPGYLFEEIGKISHESVGCCQCLLEYLLERLQTESCHVKLKVLKILQHLCGTGSLHFLTELRRNATFIQEVTVYSGPPDPIHGTALYQRVRLAAQELASQLFADTVSPQAAPSPRRVATPPMGMGSESAITSGMQGFGYSPGKHPSGGGFLDKIQKAAEVVASAVLPPAEHPGIRLRDNRYQAVAAPSVAVEVAIPACAYSLPSHGLKAPRCPGLAGGGWEDTDSGHSSRDSSQENGNASRASLAGSSGRSGTDSQSGASRESGDLSERAEAMHPGDCGQEVALINSLTEGSKAFLSREESQHFIKECATLNCEVVLELLCRRLQEPVHLVQMRALCAIACLMSSDLLSLDHMFGATHKWLAPLSEGPPGAVSTKATKLLRQFEALMGGVRPDTASCPTATGPSPLDSASKLPGALVFSLGTASDSQVGAPHPVVGDGQNEAASAAGRGGPETDSSGHEALSEMSEPELWRPTGFEDREEQAGLHAAGTAGRPSLFSGMELVTRGKHVCPPAPVAGVRGSGERPSPEHQPGSSTPPQDPQLSPQHLSAFSFLNT
ncbi:AP-4 complex accessory subunit Tepsin isoform X2 [Brienomyrus brachyistius]|uniref:AP-4 complex accessory subunit Tepsin isoform X2 n=1 Tax=Brienomyrus brachyistius TaxID=42636 RepID=UPI0020B424C4|nr:AP-4 complex accessory subunit Tepsin isoform X2 [Brienomyrus brachyistius]